MSILEFAQEIAVHLGGWSATDPDPDAHRKQRALLCGPAGEKVHVRIDSYGEWGKPGQRLSFSGVYPRYEQSTVLNSYSTDFPRITCAVSRRPGAIARDVSRRFLPKYRELVAEAEALVESYTIANAKREQVASALAAVVGTEARRKGDLVHGYTVRINDKRMHGEFGLHGDTFDVELRGMSVALAMEIARVVCGYQTPEEGEP